MSRHPFFVNTLPTLTQGDLLDPLKRAIAWSVDAGFRHTLVGVSRERPDSWALAQAGLATDPRFSPIIAVNPATQHPLDTAHRLATLRSLYGNRLAINAVAGSFRNDLRAINETLPAEARRKRAEEHVACVTALLSADAPLDFRGEFYRLDQASIMPAWTGDIPPTFVAGRAREDIAGYRVMNYRPPELLEESRPRSGLRLGICARETRAEAEAAAKELFPPRREKELLLSVSLRNESTDWSRMLSVRLNAPDTWNFHLAALRGGWASAPYLVGSYEETSALLRQLCQTGFDFFLLDEPTHTSEWSHLKQVVKLARGEN